ncbi:DUF342 domain-containing protein [Trichlorobacter ammonificans]|uniref:Flagellar Assembly Protein A N-terminal region domain-containing protein n=1 Tax=Trichlorobacter ammonificans TaxID=2916410 RepID=A0ABM9D9I3_9BACT|nr:FapA family protein [Trichlorobacter ammonificans]CAH2031226.1 conserved protein of unknown function [Trichlorobacter ammonificans]
MSEPSAEPQKTIVLQAKRQGYTVSFEITPNRLECWCSYAPSGLGGAPLTETDLTGFLRQYKILEGIQQESLQRLLHAAATGTAVSNLLLAVGTPMVVGRNGFINLAVQPPAPEEGDAGNNDNQVDFRQVQVFLNVDPGDLIGTIMAPEPGTPGMTIHGETIPPQAGVPLSVKIGQNVRLDDDGVSLFATATGRIYCKEADISVEELYTVSGDVDFKVGNIQFKGFVEIKGDVLDGFSVQADKGIRIHGNVGACTIKSQGDISVCGMNGQGRGTIVCGGNLNANFLYDTAIECDGTVTAEVEIRNCTINCLGAIKVAKGGLAGGESVALGGIETAVLGTVTSLKTRVIAGAHHRDLFEINQLFNDLKQLIEQFSSSPAALKNPMDFSVRKLAITKQIQEIRSRVYENCNPKVNVRKHLYEGVTIVLGTLSEQVKEERDGPLTIIENTLEGGFRYLGMTGLEFRAADIEQSFVLQAQRENAA